MVVNAPQSNILSAAEHTHRAAARAGAQRPAGQRRPARPGAWNRSKWEGVELHGKTLGIVGLGRVGVLVAQRAHAFGMRLVAYDPFVSADRARQLGVAARADRRGARRRRPTSSRSTCRRRPRRSGSSTPRCSRTPSPGCGSSTPAAAASSTRTRWPTRSRDGPARRRRDRRVRQGADHRVAAVRARQRRRHAAPRRVDGRGAGQGGRDDRRAGRARAARRLRAVRRERRRVRGVGDACGRSCRSPSGSGGCSPGWPAARRRRSRSTYEGEIADYDCRVLTLSVLKGVLAPVVDEPVSFVNAPQIAEERGIVGARDEVVGRARLREPHRRARRSRAARTSPARCSASSRRRASSASTTTSVDLPPARHMLVVHNDDSPGHDRPRSRRCSATPASTSRTWMSGQSPSGEAALMVIATDTPVPADVVDASDAPAGRAVRPRHRPRLGEPGEERQRSRPDGRRSASDQCLRLRGAQPVGRRGRGVDVAAIGLGALVVR